MSTPAEDLLSDPLYGSSALIVIARGLVKETADLLRARNFPAVIDKATTGIKFLEKGMANNPLDLRAVLGPYLFDLYVDRGLAYGNSGPNAQALQDIETALAMPAAYQNAQMIDLLQNLKAQAKAQIKPAGAPQAQSSSSSSQPQKKGFFQRLLGG